MEILAYLGQFTIKEQRRDAARQLAQLLKAEDLILFIKDQELNVWLPGQGFPQTLPNGKLWRQFLNKCEETTFSGEVPYREKMCPAVAVRCGDQSVAVLIGGRPTQKDLGLLSQLQAIVAPLLKQEQQTQVAESRAIHNIQLTEKAERMTATLEAIRKNLMEAVEENNRLLLLTQRQNKELAAANEELVSANEEIMAGIEELNLTNQRLLSINADLDNFIYTASHDLKSPISNIEGLMTMLAHRLQASGWEGAETSKIINMIELSIDRFKRTIGDLTKIAKLGKDTPEKTASINLSEVIKEVEDDLYITILESKAQLINTVDEKVTIRFSHKNFKSVVYNLLSNSIKFREKERKPVICIDWTEEGEFGVLRVKDNGIGMEIRDRSKLFGLFRRFHTHVEGTGIGLYIVKKIIEDTGGKIEVESKVGEGSTFKVYFKR